MKRISEATRVEEVMGAFCELIGCTSEGNLLNAFSTFDTEYVERLAGTMKKHGFTITAERLEEVSEKLGPKRNPADILGL